MHATGLPIEVRLTVFSTGADRLEVLTAVSANAFLEFGHMSFSIYKHLMSMCHSSTRAEVTSLVHDLQKNHLRFSKGHDVRSHV